MCYAMLGKMQPHEGGPLVGAVRGRGKRTFLRMERTTAYKIFSRQKRLRLQENRGGER
jgi:hypothetical protein